MNREKQFSTMQVQSENAKANSKNQHTTKGNEFIPNSENYGYDCIGVRTRFIASSATATAYPAILRRSRAIMLNATATSTSLVCSKIFFSIDSSLSSHSLKFPSSLSKDSESHSDPNRQCPAKRLETSPPGPLSTTWRGGVFVSPLRSTERGLGGEVWFPALLAGH